MASNSIPSAGPVDQYTVLVCPHCGSIYSQAEAHICHKPNTFEYLRQSQEQTAILTTLQVIYNEIATIKKQLEKLDVA